MNIFRGLLDLISGSNQARHKRGSAKSAKPFDLKELMGRMAEAKKSPPYEPRKRVETPSGPPRSASGKSSDSPTGMFAKSVEMFRGSAKDLADKLAGRKTIEPGGTRPPIPDSPPWFGGKPAMRSTASGGMKPPPPVTDRTGKTSPLTPGRKNTPPPIPGSSKRPGGKSGGMLGGMASKLGKLGPIGMVIGLGTAAVAAGKKLYNFALGVNQANREISLYNGQMAAAFAKLDIANIKSEMKLANATQGSSSDLADEMRLLKQDTQSLREMVAIIKNTVAKGGARMLRIGTKLIEGLPEIQALRIIADKIEGNTRPRTDVDLTEGLMTNIASGNWIPPRNPQEIAPLEPILPPQN